MPMIMLGKSFICEIVLNFKRLAPRIAGKDSKKENLNDSSGLTFENSPVDMVIPEREMPGNTANIWLTPIIMADNSLTFLSLLLTILVKRRINPVIPRKIPTIGISVKHCSIWVLKITAKSTIGIVPTII
jgi:hypothetical protein